jgi:hypothetical protein
MLIRRVYTIDMVPKFLSLLVRIDLSIVEFHQKYALVGLIVGMDEKEEEEEEGVLIIGKFDCDGLCDRATGCKEGEIGDLEGGTEEEEAVRKEILNNLLLLKRAK